MKVRALVIPVEGPVEEVEIPDREWLADVQALVGGYVQALPLPAFIAGHLVTSYVNEEGKGVQEPNMRATDFMVPGIGLFPGDYIAGPFVVVGFDPARDLHLDVPPQVERRVRLIEREAS